MLKIENLSVSYGEIRVLWDVSMEIRQGQVVALVGANAAGKSTIINTISGLVKPVAGSISFQGREITALPPYRIVEQGICQVPEGRRLFPQMTVLENLELGAYTQRARKKIKDSMEMVFSLLPDLKEKQKQLAGSLSGGQQQMCAIGRGLMACPDLLMLDELSLGLAPLVVKMLFELIVKIARQGMTILLVEQNVKHSLAIADTAFVLENGRIVMWGKAGELAGDPGLKKAYLGM